MDARDGDGGTTTRAEAPRLELDPAWFDAIALRRSRRRYAPATRVPARPSAPSGSCAGASASRRARAPCWSRASDGVFTGLGERLGGAYGRVEGAPWTAAFVAPEGAEVEAGYVGEAFVLEATRLGLGTCWVAGMFDRDTADRLTELGPGERVVAVTPVGHPLERKALVERMMSAAVRSAARRQVEDIAPGLVRGGSGAWPAWAVSAVEAARLAPSGANRQPWRFRLDDRGLALAAADGAYWTAPIDCGIAMLHAELGALHEGVHGDWVRLASPDVARFEPAPGRPMPG